MISFNGSVSKWAKELDCKSMASGLRVFDSHRSHQLARRIMAVLRSLAATINVRVVAGQP